MSKICVVAFGNPENSKVWSGTPSRIVNYFRAKYIDEVSTLNLRELGRVPYQISRVFSKVTYRRGTTRDPFLFQIEANILANKIKKVDADTFLFVAEHCLNVNKRHDAHYYVYLDSLLRPHLQYDKRKQKPFAKLFLRKYETNDQISFMQMDGIFTQNQWSKDFLIREYGIEENKIYNVGFGINANFYEGHKDYTNQQLMIVLRRGTEYVKGLYLLIDAFKKLKTIMPEIKLAVFGTTAEEVEGITYYENCSRNVMLDMYKKSSLYVMPNILEPNGITYLEAMASKTPIVGLNRFSVPEFTGYGKFGFICNEDNAEELANTIRVALNDTDKLYEMGIQGQKFVKERYNWEIVLNKMEDVMMGTKQEKTHSEGNRKYECTEKLHI